MFRQLALVVFLYVTFVGTVVAANYAVSVWGVQPVGFGLAAPVGAWFAGLAFILRDELQRRTNGWVSLAAIAAGVMVSATVASPALAVASAGAFAVSEVADLVVFTAAGQGLSARLLSNVVGAVLDTTAFLLLAQSVLGPFSWTAFSGQVLVKAVYLAPVAVLAWYLMRRSPAGALQLTPVEAR